MEELRRLFVRFIPEFCITAGVMDNGSPEISTLAEFIPTQPTDADYGTTFATTGKLNTCFRYDNEEGLAHRSPLHGASHRVVPVSVCPLSFCAGTLPFCLATLVNVNCTTL